MLPTSVAPAPMPAVPSHVPAAGGAPQAWRDTQGARRLGMLLMALGVAVVWAVATPADLRPDYRAGEVPRELFDRAVVGLVLTSPLLVLAAWPRRAGWRVVVAVGGALVLVLLPVVWSDQSHLETGLEPEDLVLLDVLMCFGVGAALVVLGAARTSRTVRALVVAAAGAGGALVTLGVMVGWQDVTGAERGALLVIAAGLLVVAAGSLLLARADHRVSAAGTPGTASPESSRRVVVGVGSPLVVALLISVGTTTVLTMRGEGSVRDAQAAVQDHVDALAAHDARAVLASTCGEVLDEVDRDEFEATLAAADDPLFSEVEVGEAVEQEVGDRDGWTVPVALRQQGRTVHEDVFVVDEDGMRVCSPELFDLP